jgi:hypothetical protein
MLGLKGNLVVFHPQLSHKGFPMDGTQVGVGTDRPYRTWHMYELRLIICNE